MRLSIKKVRELGWEAPRWVDAERRSPWERLTCPPTPHPRHRGPAWAADGPEVSLPRAVGAGQGEGTPSGSSVPCVTAECLCGGCLSPAAVPWTAVPTLTGSAEQKAGQGAAGPVPGQPRGSGERAPEPTGCSALTGNRGPRPQTLPTRRGGCRALPRDPAWGELGRGEWARPPRGAFGGTRGYRCQAWTPAGLQEEASAPAPASYPQGPETDLLHGERESWGFSQRVRLRACPTEDIPALSAEGSAGQGAGVEGRGAGGCWLLRGRPPPPSHPAPTLSRSLMTMPRSSSIRPPSCVKGPCTSGRWRRSCRGGDGRALGTPCRVWGWGGAGDTVPPEQPQGLEKASVRVMATAQEARLHSGRRWTDEEVEAQGNPASAHLPEGPPPPGSPLRCPLP